MMCTFTKKLLVSLLVLGMVFSGSAYASIPDVDDNGMFIVKFRDAFTYNTPPDLDDGSVDFDEGIRLWIKESTENRLKMEEIVRAFGKGASYEFSPADKEKKFNSIKIHFGSYATVESFKDLYDKYLGDIPAPVKAEDVTEKDVENFFNHMIAVSPKKLSKEDIESSKEHARENVLAPSDEVVSAEYKKALDSKEEGGVIINPVLDRNSRRGFLTVHYLNSLFGVEMVKYKHDVRYEIMFEANVDFLKLPEVSIEKETSDDYARRIMSATSVYMTESGWGSIAYIPEANKLD